jgi:ketosteroid isomerase-like protein
MADESNLKRDRFEIVRAWHNAVNRGDAESLVALSDDDIEVGGPRGSARGHAVLRDWLERAGIQLAPRRWFASPARLVVEQVATWHGPDGAITDPQIIASSFTVADGRVMRTLRYESLEEALAASGLTLADEVQSANG